MTAVEPCPRQRWPKRRRGSFSGALLVRREKHALPTPVPISAWDRRTGLQRFVFALFTAVYAEFPAAL